MGSFYCFRNLRGVLAQTPPKMMPAPCRAPQTLWRALRSCATRGLRSRAAVLCLTAVFGFKSAQGCVLYLDWWKWAIFAKYRWFPALGSEWSIHSSSAFGGCAAGSTVLPGPSSKWRWAASRPFHRTCSQSCSHRCSSLFWVQGYQTLPFGSSYKLKYAFLPSAAITRPTR